MCVLRHDVAHSSDVAHPPCVSQVSQDAVAHTRRTHTRRTHNILSKHMCVSTCCCSFKLCCTCESTSCLTCGVVWGCSHVYFESVASNKRGGGDGESEKRRREGAEGEGKERREESGGGAAVGGRPGSCQALTDEAHLSLYHHAHLSLDDPHLFLYHHPHLSLYPLCLYGVILCHACLQNVCVSGAQTGERRQHQDTLEWQAAQALQHGHLSRTAPRRRQCVRCLAGGHAYK